MKDFYENCGHVTPAAKEPFQRRVDWETGNCSVRTGRADGRAKAGAL